ncbi:AraC family transcriptional regulator [Halobacillus shinanisalinarum]|uniref:AraC family transcriptional regulator n=1 Tax=Halobacillus shinanisalinarum TaxID=2932258 RepID=A0ABY4GYN3_9BACI|nr:AraC family transcriptional regulator [Halobacillus shinanisalinarum]UOQ93310.1 AraC family transcriptional regulator [Halobacillus shinanisalinarum]
MATTPLVFGKSFLNQLIQRILLDNATFHVHYWGGVPNHYDTLLHKHAFFEVCFVVDGEGYYIDGNQKYSLVPNTIFLSRPGVLHQIKSEDGLKLIYLAFELIETESCEEWIRIMKKAEQCSNVVLYVTDDTPVALLWKSLYLQAAKPSHALTKETLANLSSSFLYVLLQTFIPFPQNDKQKVQLETKSPLLNQVKLHIRDNLSGTLKLTDIAEHFHVSKRHLSRLFVEELRETYTDFVQNERLQHAATLLKMTQLPIKDIAFESGFSSVHYFTRVFTSSMRHSPGRFRTLYKHNEITSFGEGE